MELRERFGTDFYRYMQPRDAAPKPAPTPKRSYYTSTPRGLQSVKFRTSATAKDVRAARTLADFFQHGRHRPARPRGPPADADPRR